MPIEDPLHTPGPDHLHWTTTNVGEAIPGVLTPLSWTLWHAALEEVSRRVWQSLGVFSKQEARNTEPDRWVFRAFHGRAALNVEAMALLGNRMPGTTGQQVVAGVFGEAPATIDYTKSRRRYPHVALGLIRNFALIRGQVARAATTSDRWWRQALPAVRQARTRWTSERRRQLMHMRSAD